MKRAWIVPLFVLGVLLPGYLYLGFRLADSWWGWSLIAIPFVLIATFPLRFRSKDPEAEAASKLDHFLFHSTLASMGVLTFLFVVTIFRDVIWLGAKWMGISSAFGSANDFANSTVVLALTALAMLVGTVKAARGPAVKKVDVPIENIPKELEGFTIVQISDLHVGPTIRKKYVEKVVRLTNSVKPHIVTFTGDIGDGHLSELKEHIQPISAIEAQLGVFYVPGNHEYYWSISEWTGKMTELGAQVLMNQGATVAYQGKLVLIGGITDPVAAQLGERQQPNPAKALQAAPHADFKVLLSHRPGFAREAASLGFDLQLSGHTHGGQFFPWTLVVRMVHEYFLGLEKCGRMWIYVSGGTGSWGPLVRLGTTPELTVLRIISSGADSTRSKV